MLVSEGTNSTVVSDTGVLAIFIIEIYLNNVIIIKT